MDAENLSPGPGSSGTIEGRLEQPEQLTVTQQSKAAKHEPIHDQTTPESPQFSFVDQVAAYRIQLEAEFDAYKQSLADRSQESESDGMDWEDLELRYQGEMKDQLDEEQTIMHDINLRFQQFMLWMQVSNEKETERAFKRLRTRMTFVQNSESQLTEKQEHYSKVLEAFQNAMSLLGNL